MTHTTEGAPALRQPIPEAVLQFMTGLTAQIPEMRMEVTPAFKEGGRWFIDVTDGTHEHTVTWRPDLGFGLTSEAHSTYGEGVHEQFTDSGALADRLAVLLRSGEATRPVDVPGPAGDALQHH